MGIFGNSREIEQEDLQALADENYRFIKIGRDVRRPIDRIVEYKNISKGKMEVTFDDGKVFVLGVDEDVFDAVVNLSGESMNRLEERDRRQ